MKFKGICLSSLTERANYSIRDLPYIVYTGFVLLSDQAYPHTMHVPCINAKKVDQRKYKKKKELDNGKAYPHASLARAGF